MQLRGLRAGDAAELAQRAAAAGLLPSAAHDRARNIMASPLAGLAGRPPLRPLVRALDAVLLRDAELAALPGRFLFSLDDGTGGAGLAACDVGLLLAGRRRGAGDRRAARRRARRAPVRRDTVARPSSVVAAAARAAIARGVGRDGQPRRRPPGRRGIGGRGARRRARRAAAALTAGSRSAPPTAAGPIIARRGRRLGRRQRQADHP